MGIKKEISPQHRRTVPFNACVEAAFRMYSTKPCTGAFLWVEPGPQRRPVSMLAGEENAVGHLSYSRYSSVRLKKVVLLPGRKRCRARFFSNVERRISDVCLLLKRAAFLVSMAFDLQRWACMLQMLFSSIVRQMYEGKSPAGSRYVGDG